MNLNIIRYSELNIISILCACIIPLLVTGPFLPDLFLSLLSLWFVYYSIKNRIYIVYLNRYFLIFIAFYFVCILSSLLSENVFYSLKTSLVYIRIGIFALLISYLINQEKKILDYFYYAFLITFSALVVDGYYQYFIGTNLFGYVLLSHRVSSFFGEELILGSYLVRLLPLLLALFLSRKSKQYWEYYFFSIFLIMVIILIFMAGERSSLFFLFLSFSFIGFFMSAYKLFRLGIIIISLGLMILLITFDKQYQYRYIQSPITTMGFDGSKKYIFTPEHDSLIRTGWNMFLDKPFFGHGPKSFRIKCKTYDDGGIKPCDTHPHNFYIQLLAETGIVGFSFLFGTFVYFVYLTLRHIFDHLKYKKALLSDYQICLFSGLLISIWPITTNGNIFTNHLMLLYSIPIGFFIKK
jgi:O-antigen ligase